MTRQIFTLSMAAAALIAAHGAGARPERPQQEPADLILHHGKIVTVDEQFSIREAIAVRGDSIVLVGTNAEVMRRSGAGTRLIDLQGKMVLPGLIDSHTHPTGACMTEFDHPIPQMETIQDVLDYIRGRAAVLPEGTWIQVRQVFITRLKEQRYPTRAELDRAAPRHPVVFSTGPDASLNSLALKLSGIDRDFKVTDGGAGKVEKDASGEPTGILRNLGRYVKARSSGRTASEQETRERLRALFRDYNSTGFTAIADRDADRAAIDRYQRMRNAGELTVRISVSHHLDTSGSVPEIEAAVRRIAADPLRKPDPLLRIVGVKTFLDGGMLTGSAYMREPWGVSSIYAITDPTYRGLLFIPRERLLPTVRATVGAGMQFTAHSVGDGAVHALLDVYEELSRSGPIRQTRPCITHSNFMSRDAVEMLSRLGVVVDIQPAWLYLDTRTLVAHFGYDRLRWFQPLRSIFAAGATAGGGSDHMQKIGSLRSINPYNPFLAMWVAITRRARDFDRPLHPEEAISREQAIRFYTRNNAIITFRDEQTGSLEVGKLADMVVLDRDLLACPVDDIRDTRVLQTFLGGRGVYAAAQ